MADVQQPILVLTRGDDPNRLAGYLAELWRTEGLNWVEVRDVDRRPLTPQTRLPGVVVAAAVEFAPGAAARLAAYVRDGGALLAARPDAALATEMGLQRPRPLWDEAPSRYVLLDRESPVVTDLPWPAGGAQCFGRVASYLPATAAASQAQAPGETPGHVAAWLAPFPGQPTRFPAVLCAEVGRGRVAILAFDPAESAVRQQQGDPAQASTGETPDFDGDGAFRPNDLFVGRLDPALRDVPQADLQRSLLIRVVEWLSETRPLPRLWRFPAGAPAAALVDGDSDAMSAADFRQAIETCDRYGAPFGTYLKPEHLAVVEPAEERAARERGHRFGPHPWAGPQPSPEELRHVLEADCAAFAARYGYRPRIHRGHWLIWPGWIDHARSLAGAGIQLDANFAAGRTFQGGYVNGTGLPAWFVDEAARPLGVFEQSTISTDDGWLQAKTGLPAMTLAEAIARSYRQIDEAVEQYHTVYHPYFHPVSLKGGRANRYPTLPWLEAALAHAQVRGVPFLDAERWIDWNVARRGVRLVELAWAGGGMQAALVAETAIRDLTVVVPVARQMEQVAATVDGEPAEEAVVVKRHGRRYASVPLSLRAGETRRIAIAGLTS